MLVHQGFRFGLDPGDRSHAALASHAGSSRFAHNGGLALVKARLEQRGQIRLARFKELLFDDEVERLARTFEVPWNLPALRREWNRTTDEIAPSGRGTRRGRTRAASTPSPGTSTGSRRRNGVSAPARSASPS